MSQAAHAAAPWGDGGPWTMFLSLSMTHEPAKPFPTGDR